MVSSPPQPSTITYNAQTQQRAKQALCCAPFRLSLFRAMMTDSVPLLTIADQMGVDRGYTTQRLSEQRVERHLLWLIQVGLLRREVDGQGITDSFRLTPLGRQMIDPWQEAIPQPSICDRISNRLRWTFKLAL